LKSRKEVDAMDMKDIRNLGVENVCKDETNKTIFWCVRSQTELKRIAETRKH
jgi:hypothetical protein